MKKFIKKFFIYFFFLSEIMSRENIIAIKRKSQSILTYNQDHSKFISTVMYIFYKNEGEKEKTLQNPVYREKNYFHTQEGIKRNQNKFVTFYPNQWILNKVK